MAYVKQRSNQASSSLSMYLKEIGARPLLTADEEKSLARKVQKGDELARRKFIESNLRLVVHVAKRYGQIGDPEFLMDLIQEGNLGLFRAVDRFDPERGHRFSTYAMYWIRQAIQRALTRRLPIRLPEHIFDQVRKLRKVRHRLYQDLGRHPSVIEMAVELEMEEEYVRKLEEYSQETVSLDQPVRGNQEDDAAVLGEILRDLEAPQPEFIANQQILRAQVREIMEELPERHQAIVRMRFGLGDDEVPHTLEQVGKEFGVSRERIRQIQNSVFDRMRKRQLLQSHMENTE
jgi:RNA polymerase primary sigma factor